MIDKDQLAQRLENSEKPDLTIAIELAEYVHKEIEQLREQINHEMNTRLAEAVNSNAKTVLRMNHLEEAFKSLRDDLERRSRERAEKEFKEAQARYVIAQEHKDQLTTAERLEASKLFDAKMDEAERTRRERRRVLWQEKVLPNLITGSIMVVAAPAILGLFTLLLLALARSVGLVVQLPTGP